MELLIRTFIIYVLSLLLKKRSECIYKITFVYTFFQMAIMYISPNEYYGWIFLSSYLQQIEYSNFDVHVLKLNPRDFVISLLMNGLSMIGNNGKDQFMCLFLNNILRSV